jgi:hypothetical protein
MIHGGSLPNFYKKHQEALNAEATYQDGGKFLTHVDNEEGFGGFPPHRGISQDVLFSYMPQ